MINELDRQIVSVIKFILDEIKISIIDFNSVQLYRPCTVTRNNVLFKL